jgi:hypothetical protein
MNWKYATIVLGVAVAYMLYRSSQASAAPAPYVNPAPPPPGPLGVNPDTRGTQSLGVQQMLMGNKAVAEGAKTAILGPVKAAAREVGKVMRAA